MSLPRCVGEVIRNHVTLELECIDRMYLNVYQPDLQLEHHVFRFLREQRGTGAVSSRYFQEMTRIFVHGIENFAQQQNVPIITFEKKQRKDDVAAEYRARFQGTEGIDALLRKWLARLPHPYTAQDRAAGYRYDISLLQAEFSLTQVLDRPVAGRIFFEEVIRENLDLGRPDQVQLIFQRRVSKRTPGRFRARVLTDGVLPSLHVDYKSSRIKQYLKQLMAWLALAHELAAQRSTRHGNGAEVN